MEGRDCAIELLAHGETGTKLKIKGITSLYDNWVHYHSYMYP